MGVGTDKRSKNTENNMGVGAEERIKNTATFCADERVRNTITTLGVGADKRVRNTTKQACLIRALKYFGADERVKNTMICAGERSKYTFALKSAVKILPRSALTSAIKIQKNTAKYFYVLR